MASSVAAGLAQDPMVYVSNPGAESLQGFSTAAGHLSQTAGPLYTVGEMTSGVAAAPNGNLLFRATAEGAVFVDILASDGTVRQGNAGLSVARVPHPAAVAVDRAGKLLFVASSNPSALHVFHVDPSNGTLQMTGQGAISLEDGTATQVYVTPNNRYIFVSLGSGGVDGFSFNAQDGMLEDRIHIAALQPGIFQDNAIASDSGSKFLFVGEQGVGIRVFTSGLDGTLMEISGSPFVPQTGSRAAGPSALLFAPANGELYASYANRIAAYAVSASGGLTLVASTPFSPEATPAALLLDRTGNYLVALSQGANLQMFLLAKPISAHPQGASESSRTAAKSGAR